MLSFLYHLHLGCCKCQRHHNGKVHYWYLATESELCGPTAHSCPTVTTQCWVEGADGDLESHYQVLNQDNRHAIWKKQHHLVSHHESIWSSANIMLPLANTILPSVPVHFVFTGHPTSYRAIIKFWVNCSLNLHTHNKPVTFSIWVNYINYCIGKLTCRIKDPWSLLALPSV